MKITWKRKTARYTNGINGYIGKIIIGSVDWDGTSSRTSELKYRVTCTLPQIKRVETNFATEQEGKDKLESLVNSWFNALECDK